QPICSRAARFGRKPCIDLPRECGAMFFNRRLKQQLAEANERLATTWQIKESLYSELLVIEIDPQGRACFVNDNFLQAMHYQREQLHGRAFDELIPPSFRNHANCQ